MNFPYWTNESKHRHWKITSSGYPQALYSDDTISWLLLPSFNHLHQVKKVILTGRHIMISLPPMQVEMSHSSWTWHPLSNRKIPAGENNVLSLTNQLPGWNRHYPRTPHSSSQTLLAWYWQLLIICVYYLLYHKWTWSVFSKRDLLKQTQWILSYYCVWWMYIRFASHASGYDIATFAWCIVNDSSKEDCNQCFTKIFSPRLHFMNW